MLRRHEYFVMQECAEICLFWNCFEEDRPDQILNLLQCINDTGSSYQNNIIMQNKLKETWILCCAGMWRDMSVLKLFWRGSTRSNLKNLTLQCIHDTGSSYENNIIIHNKFKETWILCYAGMRRDMSVLKLFWRGLTRSNFKHLIPAQTEKKCIRCLRDWCLSASLNILQNLIEHNIFVTVFHSILNQIDYHLVHRKL